MNLNLNQVVNPRARPQLPPNMLAHEAGQAHTGAAAAAAEPRLAGAAGEAVDAGGGAKRGRPPATGPVDLLPALAAFLLASPGIRAIAKVVQVRAKRPA